MQIIQLPLEQIDQFKEKCKNLVFLDTKSSENLVILIFQNFFALKML